MNKFHPQSPQAQRFGHLCGIAALGICLPIILASVILDSGVEPEQLHTMPEVQASDGDWLQPEYNSKGEPHTPVQMAEGDDIKQRTLDFVRKHCVPEVEEVFDLVYQYSEMSGIKPQLIFAMALAESECGKQMSTNGNIINYGNNDRGTRIGKAHIAQGFIHGIDGLHNRYMRGLTNLGQMSQGGRYRIGARFSCADAPAPFKCWATSEENWHKNMIRALTSIYGERVPDDYEFRI